MKLGHRRVCFVVDSGTCFFVSHSTSPSTRLLIVLAQKLQRAIINSRGRTKDNVAIGPSPHLGQSEDLQRSDGEGSSTPRERKKMSGVNSAGNPVGQKRKYRRHPKVRPTPSATSDFLYTMNTVAALPCSRRCKYIMG